MFSIQYVYSLIHNVTIFLWRIFTADIILNTVCSIVFLSDIFHYIPNIFVYFPFEFSFSLNKLTILKSTNMLAYNLYFPVPYIFAAGIILNTIQYYFYTTLFIVVLTSVVVLLGHHCYDVRFLVYVVPFKDHRPVI